MKKNIFILFIDILITFLIIHFLTPFIFDIEFTVFQSAIISLLTAVATFLYLIFLKK